MRLTGHPRIHAKHPELSEEDALEAFGSIFKYVYRSTGECVGVGVAGKQR